MRKLLWQGLALFALGLIFSLFARGCCDHPEDKIAHTLNDLSHIMEQNMSSPKRGAQKLFSFFEQNLPINLAMIGELILALDKEDTKEKLRARAERAARRLAPSIVRYQNTSERFADAVENDEDAKRWIRKRLERWEGLEDKRNSMLKNTLRGELPFPIPGLRAPTSKLRAP